MFEQTVKGTLSLMTRPNNPMIPCLGFTPSKSEVVFSSAETMQVDNYSSTAPPTAEQCKGPAVEK